MHVFIWFNLLVYHAEKTMQEYFDYRIHLVSLKLYSNILCTFAIIVNLNFSFIVKKVIIEIYLYNIYLRIIYFRILYNLLVFLVSTYFRRFEH